MAELKFRDLRADEIDCRIATISEKGLSLLLYKDARCDMNILDETVGAFNWQRSHSRENANCIVSIWDPEKEQWISKEDTGTESNTEAAKGLASDSFKRACFNWGIGRELYTAPFIWISADDCKITKRNDGKIVSYDKFSVKEIKIVDKKIVGLTISNDTQKKKTVFSMAPASDKKAIKEAYSELITYCTDNGIDLNHVVDICKLTKESSLSDFQMALDYVKNIYKKGEK